jgi:hypothetical protein
MEGRVCACQNRWMLSIGTIVLGAADVRDAADQAAEVERLVSLGAARVDWDLYPDDADFIVLADTEGNRFCVIDTGRG